VKNIIFLLAIIVGGCSKQMVTTRKDDPVRCTRHYAAPVGDSLFAGGLVIGGATSAIVGTSFARSYGEESDLITVGILSLGMLVGAYYTGKSANYGYSKVAECRASRKR
jgi:hypothetical protein